MPVFSILLKNAILQQKEQSKLKDNGVCKSVLEQGYQAILYQSKNRQSHRELLHKPPKAPNVARMQTSLSKQRLLLCSEWRQVPHITHLMLPKLTSKMSWVGGLLTKKAALHHPLIDCHSTTISGKKVKQKVYGGRRLPFKDLKELELKIKQVWIECCDIDVLRKALLQFRPRLKEVVRQEGGPIKQIYG